MAEKGRLRIQCFNGDDYIPVKDCKINVRRTPEGVENIEFTTPINIQLVTNDIGLTEEIELDAPPIEYSLDENSNKIPYSSYDIRVERNGFETLIIRGCQIFPEEVAYQRCNLNDTSIINKKDREYYIQCPLSFYAL